MEKFSKDKRETILFIFVLSVLYLSIFVQIYEQNFRLKKLIHSNEMNSFSQIIKNNEKSYLNLSTLAFDEFSKTIDEFPFNITTLKEKYSSYGIKNISFLKNESGDYYKKVKSSKEPNFYVISTPSSSNYTFTHPYYQEDEFKGFFEVSIDFFTVIKNLNDNQNNEFSYLIKRSSLDEKNYINQTLSGDTPEFNYSVSKISDALYEDNKVNKEIKKIRILKNEVLLKSIKEQFSSKLFINKIIEESIIHEESTYTVFFLPFFDKNSEVLGFFISAKKDDAIEMIESVQKERILNLALLVIIIIFFVVYFSYTKNKIRIIAEKDKLTGAYRRNVFYTECNAIRDAKEEKLAVLMIDIDNFKEVNDSFGHAEGDKVLKFFADSFNSHIRSHQSDMLFRWGGDEFLIILRNVDLKTAVTIANRVNKDSYTLPSGRKVTTSIGVTPFNYKIDEKVVLVDADLKLYESKERGRNCVSPRLDEV